MKRRVSVIGLGKLGLPMAVLFASKGFKVVGVDVDKRVVNAVNEGKCPVYEPGVAELLRKHKGYIVATDDYKFAVNNTDVSFIVVPTPSEEDGSFSLKYVEAAGREIGKNLKGKDGFHLVVLVSTVLPGGTEKLKQVLESSSGRRCGVDFGLCYSPEFIALGSVLKGLTKPDLVLIGESDPKSGELLSEIYRKTCENNPPIVRTNFWNAELGKILLNAYVTMKISFANTAAELCEKVPGGDVDVVSRILGLDSRIGEKYLAGGLAYGGPCFPRDNRAVARFAQAVGVRAKLPEATHEVNLYQSRRVVDLIKSRLGGLKGLRVAVLGLTYKPGTDVVEESSSIKIVEGLIEEGAAVSVYDPAGMENAKKVLGESVRYAPSLEDCLKGAELCILATPWDEFKKLKPEDFLRNMSRPALLDCWRLFKDSEFKRKLKYFAIGLGA